ncbi:MAG: SLC13 family permease [Ottowia sp.]
MTIQIALVLGIAVVAMALFMTERLRMDVVALLVLVSLALLGLVKPQDALSGFSNPATITVAAMFILAAGIENTGSLSAVGTLLAKTRHPTFFLLAMFGLMAVTSPFVNNTAVVAVFIPVVVASSLHIGMPPTKALIPMSYVSQMAGACTLIGTSTNLIVNSVARGLGHRGFTMFEFLPLGALCLVAGCAYLLTVGRWLLPSEGNVDTPLLQEGGRYVTELRVEDGSKLIGQTVTEAGLSADYRVYVLELWRGEQTLWSPRSEELQAQDVLLVRGRWSDLQKLKEDTRLAYQREQDKSDGGGADAQDDDPAPAQDAAGQQEQVPQAQAEAARDDAVQQQQPDASADAHGDGGEEEPEVEPKEEPDKQVMVEVMVAPNSVIIGHRIEALERALPRSSSILGLQRRGEVVRDQLDDVRLAVGDILLVLMPEPQVANVRGSSHMIVLSQRDAPLPRGWRAPFALLVMVAVVTTAALGWVDVVIAAVAGAIAMVLAGCLKMDRMYEAMDGRILLLMAGLLPLGAAMEQTGAAQFIVDHSIGLVSSFGPHVVLAVLYLVALLLSEVMSHAAAAVLLTPIAMSTAQLVDSDATPFLIAVAFSASTSFLTPVGYQTNTMVYSAGGYKFSDFVKLGAPLNLIFWVLGVVFIPVFWPFAGG